MVMRKFVGDKMSIEASSTDGGRKWSVLLYDRGHLTTYANSTEQDLNKLVASKQMRPAVAGTR